MSEARTAISDQRTAKRDQRSAISEQRPRAKRRVYFRLPTNVPSPISPIVRLPLIVSPDSVPL